MIYINDDTKTKISLLDNNDLFAIFDYDRTITDKNSETSWGILERSKIIDKNYIIDSKNLYNFYRKLEIDNSIDINTKEKYMSKWMDEQISLLMKYGINEEKFNCLLELTNTMKLRNGIEEFIKKLNCLNIPIVIISAGLGNAIIKTLNENNCFLDNVNIISNILKFENNLIKVDGYSINSINKGNVPITDNILKMIENRQSIMLFGDQISDLLMLNNFKFTNKLLIGFLANDTKNNLEEYKNYFDIVATEDEDYNNLSKILIKR